jgi:hypothetical protein
VVVKEVVFELEVVVDFFFEFAVCISGSGFSVLVVDEIFLKGFRRNTGAMLSLVLFKFELVADRSARLRCTDATRINNRWRHMILSETGAD